ncbi:migration and invasion enhancer 1 [Austrofundulus limnaeus]|uniref:Migration and invasion enhancer 1 n=1 Tax=Austrofundulus limnaeus TaxID=52670 RepID=A0A2I4CBA6_AUSLI|nr:PREDICTED: migration and invasion enhancer 1-like [Austrofundulus limnaeus]
MGYLSRYQELAVIIERRFPGAEVTGSVGRAGAFEIQINGRLVFSKFETGGFPREKDVLSQVKNTHDGKPLMKIQECEDNCTVV